MKCKDCDCCKLGWMESKPNNYVCIGVKNPFVINNINHECTEYEAKRNLITNIINKFNEVPLVNTIFEKDLKRAISLYNDKESYKLLNEFKDNLFANEFVSDEESKMLYHTILDWKEKADMYDNLCK